MMPCMEPGTVDTARIVTAAVRAACAAAPVEPATVAALCDALDAARGDARRAERRVEIAQQARTAAEVERSRFYVGLTAAQAECHAVIADAAACDAERALARRVLSASRKRG